MAQLKRTMRRREEYVVESRREEYIWCECSDMEAAEDHLGVGANETPR